MESGGDGQQLSHSSYPWDHPPPPPSNFDWGGPGFAGYSFHKNNSRGRNFQQDADSRTVSDSQFHQFNPPPDESFSGGYVHSKPHFARKRKFDHNDGGNYAKLFIGAITRTVTEEEIRHLFEEHGNVVEVVLLNDKRTGQQQEYCFVKYASIEEAERAIAALHNQFTLPGAMSPLRVKYADGERERLGMPHKVYVNGLNKEASKEEILEIFSCYGVVVDVYVMRDQSKQSRGCGFVGFSHRYMAVAAINGLDGTYVMKGCDRPLAVRFADPKKPKNGELRSASNPADLRGSNWPKSSHADISAVSTQESTTNIQAGSFSPIGNLLQCPPCEMEQPRYQRPFSPSHVSAKQLQTLQVASQSSGQLDTELQTPSRFGQTSNGNIERIHDIQSPEHDGNFVESNRALFSSGPASCALSGGDLPGASANCDWSEHICPDGYKYYYNCVASESRWEKPLEFSLYEEQFSLSLQETHLSSTLGATCEELCLMQAAEGQKQPHDFEKPHLPISCAMLVNTE